MIGAVNWKTPYTTDASNVHLVAVLSKHAEGSAPLRQGRNLVLLLVLEAALSKQVGR